MSVYTEEEAKKRWCPFAMMGPSAKEVSNGSVLTGSFSFNRVQILNKHGTILPEGTYCVASACMAWRWLEIESGDPNSGIRRTGKEMGRCGLAGAL